MPIPVPSSELYLSAAYKIFHFYYRAYIPQYAIYSADYVKEFGLVTSGNKDIDNALANTEVLCQMTIAEMAEHLFNGVNITLEDPSKSVEIYKIVQEHLKDWERYVVEMFSEVEAPIEDLKKLDELSKELHKIAINYVRIMPTGNKFSDTLANWSLNSPIIKQKERVKPPVEEYRPVTPAIVKDLFSKSNRWR